MNSVEKRENELNSRVTRHKSAEDEFYNVTVAQITSRHLKEIKKMESLVSEQLNIVTIFQKDLESSRSELFLKNGKIKEFEVFILIFEPSDILNAINIEGNRSSERSIDFGTARPDKKY
jgi:hypothetical protein